MRRTVFNTPIIQPLFAALSRLGLWAAGWRTEGSLPASGKYVLIAAPHTSNWDFPLMLAAAFIFKVDLFWMGKDSLFPFPFAGMMRGLGGIAIDRSAPGNMVEQIIERYNSSDTLVIAVPPEGTRSKVDGWKTGFYHIARGANVPIATGFLDYKRKVAGFGPSFQPSDDMATDIEAIQGFYRNITAKYPQKMSLNNE